MRFLFQDGDDGLQARIAELEVQLENERHELEIAGVAAGKLRELVEELELKAVSLQENLKESEAAAAEHAAGLDTMTEERNASEALLRSAQAALQLKCDETADTLAQTQQALADARQKITEGEGMIVEKDVRIAELEKKCCAVQ